MWGGPTLWPNTTEPPDWTGRGKQYTNRLQASFVRCWRPETKAGIEEAFSRSDFEHARGGNVLKRAPLRIDRPMLALVDRFSVEVMGPTEKEPRNHTRTEKHDIRVAKLPWRNAVLARLQLRQARSGLFHFPFQLPPSYKRRRTYGTRYSDASTTSSLNSKSFRRTQIKFSTPIPTNSCAKSPVEHLGGT